MPIENNLSATRLLYLQAKAKAEETYIKNRIREGEQLYEGGYWREYDLKRAKFYEYNFLPYLKLLGFKNIIDLVEHLEKELLENNSTLSAEEPHIKLLDIMSSSGSLARPLQGLYRPDLTQGENEYMNLYASNTEKLLQSADTLTILDGREQSQKDEDKSYGITVTTGDIGQRSTWFKFLGKKYNLITFRPEGGIEDNLGGLYTLTMIILKAYKLLEENGVMLFDYNYASKKVGPLMQIYLQFLKEEGFDIEFSDIGFYLKKKIGSPKCLPSPGTQVLERMIEMAKLIEPSLKQKLFILLKRIFSGAPIFTPEEQREAVEQ